jgi:hypothetical protein
MKTIQSALRFPQLLLSPLALLALPVAWADDSAAADTQFKALQGAWIVTAAEQGASPST